MSYASTLYRSPRTLSFWTTILFGAIVAVSALSALLGAAQFLLPYDLSAEDGEIISAWLIPQGLVMLLQFPLRIAVIVVFLVWLHRAYTNLTALKANYTEYSPGWAVGYWFIPILNIFRPLQVVQEVWRESDPEFDPELNFLSANMGTKPLLLAWWLCFLASNIAIRILDAAVESEAFPVVAVVAGILTAVAAYLAILVVREITARQDLRARKISLLTQNDQPPAPPQFNQNYGSF
jgi:hypothetical protein